MRMSPAGQFGHSNRRRADGGFIMNLELAQVRRILRRRIIIHQLPRNGPHFPHTFSLPLTAAMGVLVLNIWPADG